MCAARGVRVAGGAAEKAGRSLKLALASGMKGTSKRRLDAIDAIKTHHITPRGPSLEPRRVADVRRDVRAAADRRFQRRELRPEFLERVGTLVHRRVGRLLVGVALDDDDGAESTASADMAGAAFGGGASKKRACPPCGSEMSDDGVSVTSSVVRARHERAFPVTGVTCVGCALPAKIQPVIDFISKNMSAMSELALYKMAALVYKTKVAEPAEEEGVDVPPWDWKEIRAHFQLHSVDSRMQRYENIRTLSAMRKTLEMQLLRRDQETGEQSLDKNNAESIMKIIAASSRELTLLADPGSTKKRG